MLAKIMKMLIYLNVALVLLTGYEKYYIYSINLHFLEYKNYKIRYNLLLNSTKMVERLSQLYRNGEKCLKMKLKLRRAGTRYQN